ncbi:MAG: LLM class flavin-dependent oxidoreductase [Nitrososphaerales archaeon]
MVELAVLAEENGFDSVWVSHDIFMRSSFVTLSAIATRTKRVKLGNTILNPYTTNPGELAMYVASLDELSSGRCLCGISAGSLEYMDWLGIEAKKPLSRTKEAVELIRKLISGQNAEFQGKEFHWSKQCYMRFKPIRSTIPIYIGGQGDKMLEYSGASGDGALPLLYPPEFAEYGVSMIKQGAKKAGRDPSRVDVAGCVWISVAKDRESAIIDPLRELIAYFGPLLGAKGLASIGLTHKDFESVQETFRKSGIVQASKLVNEKMLGLAIYGSPDECISKLEKLEKAGVDEVLVGAPLGPDPKSSIEILGSQVIPRFRRD